MAKNYKNDLEMGKKYAEKRLNLRFPEKIPNYVVKD
jgi:hypothetical protein